MDEKKFGNILTVVLVVLVVLILGMLAYFGYAAYSKNKTQSNSDNALQEFEQRIEKKKKQEEKVEEETPLENPLEKLNETENNNTQSQVAEKTYLDGFEIVGRIRIPKTGVDYPILSEVTTKSLTKAVAFFYGVGLNKPGNSTIMGHNYRNGLFFSDNKKLVIGDKVYITDAESGEEVEYTIYNIKTESPDYADYMKRDTAGKREVSLSTCTDDSSARLIIFASAD